jgi:hypothetical protein
VSVASSSFITPRSSFPRARRARLRQESPAA